MMMMMMTMMTMMLVIMTISSPSIPHSGSVGEHHIIIITKQMERSHIHVHSFVHRVAPKNFFIFSFPEEVFPQNCLYRAISIRYAIFLRSFIPSKNSLYKKIIDQSDTKSVLSLVSRAVLIFTTKEQNSMKSCSCVKFSFTTLY